MTEGAKVIRFPSERTGPAPATVSADEAGGGVSKDRGGNPSVETQLSAYSGLKGRPDDAGPPTPFAAGQSTGKSLGLDDRKAGGASNSFDVDGLLRLYQEVVRDTLVVVSK